jgi:PleD family two-component response regulator
VNLKQCNILVVDDEVNIVHIIQQVLHREGFACSAAMSGREALEIVEKDPPDLMVLDINMPDLNGIEICEQVKKNIFLSHIPILMLTGRTSIEDRVFGLDSGADDYLCKPFDNREMVARIRALIRHTLRESDRNPTTNLPGNAAVERELLRRIANGEPFGICYPDLDNFKAYSDSYGFDAANKVIQMTGRILAGVVMLEGSEEDFIGHIGGDDFLLITQPDRAENICQKIVREFDEKIPSLYDAHHLAQGGFVGKDRKGEMRKFPIMTISIAVVIDEKHRFSNLSEVGKIVAKVKKDVKKLEGSQYKIDGR